MVVDVENPDIQPGHLLDKLHGLGPGVKVSEKQERIEERDGSEKQSGASEPVNLTAGNASNHQGPKAG